MVPHTAVTDIQSLTDKSFLSHGISDIQYKLSTYRVQLGKGFLTNLN